MAEPRINFPDVIRKLRNESGMTQVQLAERLEIAPTSVHRYESGTSTPSKAVIRRLLGVLLDYPHLAVEAGLVREYVPSPLNSPGFELTRSYIAQDGRTHLESLLEVKVLASLSAQEHDILAAVLFLLRSKDETAKRMLDALVQPVLNKLQRRE